MKYGGMALGNDTLTSNIIKRWNMHGFAFCSEYQYRMLLNKEYKFVGTTLEKWFINCIRVYKYIPIEFTLMLGWNYTTVTRLVWKVKNMFFLSPL